VSTALAGLPVIESPYLRFDAVIVADTEARTPMVLVGEFTQLRWRLNLAAYFKDWRADAEGRLRALVADVERRWFG
jgi:hypothetical protein